MAMLERAEISGDSIKRVVARERLIERFSERNTSLGVVDDATDPFPAVASDPFTSGSLSPATTGHTVPREHFSAGMRSRHG